MMSNEKLNDLAKDFDNIENRREIIRLLSDIDTALTGDNENGETVEIHICEGKEPLITKTYQENGWVRVNYYDSNGEMTGESFEGRWN